MELDDLKNAWLQRDAQLAEQLRINNQLLRANHQLLLDKHAREIKRLDGMGWGYWISFVIAVICFGSFIADHIDQPKFWIPAALLQIWVIAMHASHLYLRYALQRLDFGAPVLTVQKQLETIRQQRLTRFKWGMLTGQILWWTPFVVVVFQGLLSIDLYEVNVFMPRFILVNILAGVAFIPLSLWASRHLVDRCQHTKILKLVLDNLSGRDLQASVHYLNRLKEFDNPEGENLAPRCPPA